MDQKLKNSISLQQRAQTLFFVIYGIILLFVIVYSYSVLKVKKVDVLDKPKEVASQVKSTPIKVNLNLVINGTTNNYSVSLTSLDSVLDLLKQLRKENKIRYEITEYTYGVVFDEVNSIKSTENAEWKLYQDGKDITSSIRNLKLTDGATYTLMLAK